MGILSQYTVLVVDDEPILRRSLAKEFRRKGFNVLEAENGNAAFELVKTAQVHLIVSDIKMPDGSGISLLEKVRQYNPPIPVVIFMTGYSDFSEEECIAKGAKAVLAKPIDRKALMVQAFKALGIEDPVQAA